MIRGLYTAVSGMISLEAKQSSITSNLANINTNGYKAEEVNLKSFDEVMIQNRDNKNNVTKGIGTLSLGVQIDGTSIRKEQGILKATDKTTDFAIDDEGYFIVNRGNENYYTKNGSFRVSTNGYLVNSSGLNVMGINKRTNNLEPIYVGTDNFVMNDRNELSVNGEEAVYKIATATFDKDEDISKIGENLYSSQNPNLNSVVYIAQGALEESNVNLVDEMVNMLSVMRAFETNQKIVQSIDETLGKAANEIGSVR
ncbi:flagellar hook-basal body complex protein [Clostridium mediterraneense]|uniref:flagellar hook-basal body complex protein n=1 Tax=Clostridium mediterraneense TaxID=1805472 RepID=UPI0008308FB6|nr:flagellar hook-basal body complex protein [Clostridium mediterraneense]